MITLSILLLFTPFFHALAAPQLLDESLKGILQNDPAKVQNYVQLHPDAALDSVELISKYGYFSEDHRVTTEDGYILGIHRIAGSKKQPPKFGKPVVFLMHGLFGDSSNFIVSGPESGLAYILADAGYDVWLGNARGNTYSRQHVSLTVEDENYWTFSWHEIGMYDLPAMIDYILEETEQQKLFYIGHSQGGTTFFVMATQRPEYQDKIEAMFGLGPASYSGRMTSPFFQILARFTNSIHLITKLIGMHEFEPTDEFIGKLGTLMCDEDAITQPVCHNIFFLIGGINREAMNMTLVPIIIGHSPAGSSVRQVVHYGQLVRSGKFRQYDHGIIKNLKVYGQLTPPPYDLASIKTPVYIFYGSNDILVDVLDIHQLYDELGNAIAKFRVPDERFGHLEFLWGYDAKSFVYDKILGLMLRHR